MTAPAGLEGPLPSLFEDGLRLLATALALRLDQRSVPAAITAACGAMGCFLKILEAAAASHFPDPQGDIPRLRSQCHALLTLGQDSAEVLEHALEAARLSRDAASRLLMLMVACRPEARP